MEEKNTSAQQTNKQSNAVQDKTGDITNHCLTSGSVESKMFRLVVSVFPLPLPCSKAWRREMVTRGGWGGRVLSSAKPAQSREVRWGWRQNTYRGEGADTEEQGETENILGNDAMNRSLIWKSEKTVGGRDADWECEWEGREMERETLGGGSYCCWALSG